MGIINRLMKLQKAEKDPLKTKESFTTLHNTEARRKEHEQLLREYGFPSEQDPNAMRYQRFAESETDDKGDVIHTRPPWQVNEASEFVAEINDEDAPSYKHSTKARNRAGKDTISVSKGFIGRLVRLQKNEEIDPTELPRQQTTGRSSNLKAGREVPMASPSETDETLGHTPVSETGGMPTPYQGDRRKGARPLGVAAGNMELAGDVDRAIRFHPSPNVRNNPDQYRVSERGTVHRIGDTGGIDSTTGMTPDRFRSIDRTMRRQPGDTSKGFDKGIGADDDVDTDPNFNPRPTPQSQVTPPRARPFGQHVDPVPQWFLDTGRTPEEWRSDASPRGQYGRVVQGRPPWVDQEGENEEGLDKGIGGGGDADALNRRGLRQEALGAGSAVGSATGGGRRNGGRANINYGSELASKNIFEHMKRTIPSDPDKVDSMAFMENSSMGPGRMNAMQSRQYNRQQRGMTSGNKRRMGLMEKLLKLQKFTKGFDGGSDVAGKGYGGGKYLAESEREDKKGADGKGEGENGGGE